jgi:hypothetical protein
MMARTRPDYCERWNEGSCPCAQHWQHYQDAPTEHFESAQPIIEAMLHCVAARCPDRRFRRQATVQLLHPIFVEGERLRCFSD